MGTGGVHVSATTTIERNDGEDGPPRSATALATVDVGHARRRDPTSADAAQWA